MDETSSFTAVPPASFVDQMPLDSNFFFKIARLSRGIAGFTLSGKCLNLNV